MKLGKFSLSLKVKDISKSLDFYETMGFNVIDGGHINKSFKDADQMKWRILENDGLKIGLFQGMFDQNILTFNEGDVLSIQEKLKSRGVVFIKEANSGEQHISAMLSDPDGNTILFE